MGPSSDSCVELLRSFRSLVALKQAAIYRAAQESYPYAAFGLLAELVRSGESRASDLAAHRVVDASVVSRQVSQLEQAGLITRRADPADGRVALLDATAEGHRALTATERNNSEFLSAALHDWDEDEVRRLTELLQLATSDIRRAWGEDSEPAWGERPR